MTHEIWYADRFTERQIHIHIYICIYIHILISIYIHIHIHTYIYTYLHIYISTYIYIHTYLYTYKLIDIFHIVLFCINMQDVATRRWSVLKKRSVPEVGAQPSGPRSAV